MSLVIVPNVVRDAINDRLDAALAKTPDAARFRDELFNQLLAYFDEHGVVPEFELATLD
jgi:hypothetical protein